jgi:hypothetical protein
VFEFKARLRGKRWLGQLSLILILSFLSPGLHVTLHADHQDGYCSLATRCHHAIIIEALDVEEKEPVKYSADASQAAEDIAWSCFKAGRHHHGYDFNDGFLKYTQTFHHRLRPPPLKL